MTLITSLPAITPRTLPINEAAAAPFDAVFQARHLVRTASIAALSTLDPLSGYPYGTLTNLAVEADGTPFFFMAALALHCRNIESDNRISLTIGQAGASDIVLAPRLTMVGRAVQVSEDEMEAARYRYTARFPKSKLYFALRDARLYRLIIEDLQLNGGPARNASAELTCAKLRTNLEGANVLMRAQPDEIERLNALPGEAARLAMAAGAKKGHWRVTGIDPDGIDLSATGNTARLWFSTRVCNLEDLDAELRKIGHL